MKLCELNTPNINAALIEIDNFGIIKDFSQSAFEIFEGIRIGNSFYDLLCEISKEILLDAIRNLKSNTFLNPIQNKNNTKCLQIHILDITLDACKFLVTDVSPFKKLISESRENTKTLKVLLNQPNNYIALINADFSVIEINDNLLDVFEMKKKYIVGDNYLNYFDAEKANFLKEQIDRCAATRNIVEFEENYSDVWYHTMIFPVLDNLFRPYRFAIFTENVESYKRYEHELLAGKKNLEAIMNNTHDFIWSVNRNYEIIAGNESFKNIFIEAFGVPYIEGQSFFVSGSIFNPDQWKEFYDSAFEGRHYVTEWQSDDYPVFELFFNPIFDDNGEVEKVAVFAKDITERKQNERDLLNYANDLKNAKISAENANRIKSQFIANISHELRTPLNSILGFTEHLYGSLQGSEYEHYLSKILSSGRTLLTLINDILDLSKIEAGKIEVFEEEVSVLNVLLDIDNIFREKAKHKGISFGIFVEENFPAIIKTDEVRLIQILINLVNNAIKFTDLGKVEIQLLKDENDLIFKVVDSGIGIEKSQQEQIFESFYQQSGQSTKKYGGTGLGLSISRNLANLLKAELTVQSEVGIGSEFTLRFFDSDFSGKIELSNTLKFNFIENPQTIIQSDKLNDFESGNALFNKGLNIIKDCKIIDTIKKIKNATKIMNIDELEKELKVLKKLSEKTENKFLKVKTVKLIELLNSYEIDKFEKNVKVLFELINEK